MAQWRNAGSIRTPTRLGGDGLFRQAAPLLAKCDASLPVPPFLHEVMDKAKTAREGCPDSGYGVVIKVL